MVGFATSKFWVISGTKERGQDLSVRAHLPPQYISSPWSWFKVRSRGSKSELAGKERSRSDRRRDWGHTNMLAIWQRDAIPECEELAQSYGYVPTRHDDTHEVERIGRG